MLQRSLAVPVMGSSGGGEPARIIEHAIKVKDCNRMVPVLLYQDRKTEESCLGSSSTHLMLGSQQISERL